MGMMKGVEGPKSIFRKVRLVAYSFTAKIEVELEQLVS